MTAAVHKFTGPSGTEMCKVLLEMDGRQFAKRVPCGTKHTARDAIINWAGPIYTDANHTALVRGPLKLKILGYEFYENPALPGTPTTEEYMEMCAKLAKAHKVGAVAPVESVEAFVEKAAEEVMHGDAVLAHGTVPRAKKSAK